MSVAGDYEAVIGLEVHTQLRTSSKIFCGCVVDTQSAPNSKVCPVCLGLPGALPVMNGHAVELALRLGLACGSEIALHSRFARKNYFYPDLPKGYQISQYDEPLCQGGQLEFELEEGTGRFEILRMHLEEDAGKLMHEGGHTLVDLNRAGTPLLEIVGEPCLRSPEAAAACLTALRRLVRWLEVCDGNMEDGSLRCDANISLRARGSQEMGTRVELKNLNSISGVKAALHHEIERQRELLERGIAVDHETRGWDADAKGSFRMRGKERARDYRYFSEPDLPPLVVELSWCERVAAELPELPDERRERFVDEHGLSVYDATLLCEERGLSEYFEACVAEGIPARRAATWILGELLRERNERGWSQEQFSVPPRATAQLLALLEAGELSANAAKTVYAHMVESGRPARVLVEELGLQQLDDETQLRALAEEVLREHPQQVDVYLGGKDGLLGFFVGQMVQRSGGRANPHLSSRYLREALRRIQENRSL
jgi:aspartyl-tRNA(Asn)/glutamyl-tRNA(Gln) amidotransferase subunit B